MRKNKENKKEFLAAITLNLQSLMTIITVIMLIFCIFQKKLFVVVELILAIDLFLLSINNHFYYKRFMMTLVYFVVGVVILIFTILKMCGVLL